MKKFLLRFKNKYILAFTIFFVYNMFLDEVDIFAIVSQNSKLSKLHDTQAKLNAELTETKTVLKELRYASELERFAREKKYFKKDDEDVFVVTFEEDK